MKKLGIVKLLFALLCITAITVTSCNRIRNYEDPPVKEDVKPTEKQYTSPEEMLFLQAELKDNKYIESVFLDMPGETLRNVSSVLIKKDGLCSVKSVVVEYINNRYIYDNIQSLPAEQIDTIQTPHKQDSVPVLHREEADTVIGGVPYKTIRYTYEDK